MRIEGEEDVQKGDAGLLLLFFLMKTRPIFFKRVASDFR